jgi:hypothetical protein
VSGAETKGGSVTPDEEPVWEALAWRMAVSFHQHYERLAPEFGYVTRPDSAVAWENVPEANRDLMVATAGHVLTELLADYPALLMRALWEQGR